MSVLTTLRRRAAACVTAAALSGVLVACGGDDVGGRDEPSATRTAADGTEYNDADVRFATELIQHHAQAVQLSVLAQDRPLDPAVARLADRVREARVPEIETMTDWLTAWGEEIPETAMDHANAGHGGPDGPAGHGAGSDAAPELPEMLGDGDLHALEEAPDSEFQDLWLALMVEHHQGAIELALTHQEQGADGEAVELAEAVEAAQAEEVATMERLLG